MSLLEITLGTLAAAALIAFGVMVYFAFYAIREEEAEEADKMTDEEWAEVWGDWFRDVSPVEQVMVSGDELRMLRMMAQNAGTQIEELRLAISDLVDETEGE